jgi:hypothetical protein
LETIKHVFISKIYKCEIGDKHPLRPFLMKAIAEEKKGDVVIEDLLWEIVKGKEEGGAIPPIPTPFNKWVMYKYFMTTSTLFFSSVIFFLARVETLKHFRHFR